MKIAVIGAEPHIPSCLSTVLMAKEHGVHVIHVKHDEDLQMRILEENVKDTPVVVLMDSEPIEVKRKPWEDEPIILTNHRNDYYQDYSKKPSHRRDYKFHR